MINFSRSCKIFFLKNGKVHEARQTVENPIVEYSGYSGYCGYIAQSIQRESRISEDKPTRRRDIVRLFKKAQPRLIRRRSGSTY